MSRRPDAISTDRGSTPGNAGDLGWVVMAHGELLRRRIRDGTSPSRRWWRASSPTTQRADDAARRSSVDRGADRPSESAVVFCVPADESTRATPHPSRRSLGAGHGRWRRPRRRVHRVRRMGYTTITVVDERPPRRSSPGLSRMGFRLVDEERHHSFGVDLIGQVYELDLNGPGRFRLSVLPCEKRVDLPAATSRRRSSSDVRVRWSRTKAC